VNRYLKLIAGFVLLTPLILSALVSILQSRELDMNQWLGLTCKPAFRKQVLERKCKWA